MKTVLGYVCTAAFIAVGLLFLPFWVYARLRDKS